MAFAGCGIGRPLENCAGRHEGIPQGLLRPSNRAALVGNLPAYGSLGEGGFSGDLTGGRAGHIGEGSLDLVAHRPDGDFLYGVAVGDSGLLKAVVDGDRSKAADAGDFAVSVAESGGVAGSGWSDGVATDMNAHFDRFVEEEGLDQGVQLFGLRGIAG